MLTSIPSWYSNFKEEFFIENRGRCFAVYMSILQLKSMVTKYNRSFTKCSFQFYTFPYVLVLIWWCRTCLFDNAWEPGMAGVEYDLNKTGIMNQSGNKMTLNHAAGIKFWTIRTFWDDSGGRYDLIREILSRSGKVNKEEKAACWISMCIWIS